MNRRKTPNHKGKPAPRPATSTSPSKTLLLVTHVTAVLGAFASGAFNYLVSTSVVQGVSQGSFGWLRDHSPTYVYLWIVFGAFTVIAPSLAAGFCKGGDRGHMKLITKPGVIFMVITLSTILASVFLQFFFAGAISAVIMSLLGLGLSLYISFQYDRDIKGTNWLSNKKFAQKEMREVGELILLLPLAWYLFTIVFFYLYWSSDVLFGFEWFADAAETVTSNPFGEL